MYSLCSLLCSLRMFRSCMLRGYFLLCLSGLLYCLCSRSGIWLFFHIRQLNLSGRFHICNSVFHLCSFLILRAVFRMVWCIGVCVQRFLACRPVIYAVPVFFGIISIFCCFGTQQMVAAVVIVFFV